MRFNTSLLAGTKEVQNYVDNNALCRHQPFGYEGGWYMIDANDFGYTPHPDYYEDVLDVKGAEEGKFYIVLGFIEKFEGTADAEILVKFGKDSQPIYTITKNDIGNTFVAVGLVDDNVDTLNLVAHNTDTTAFIIKDLRAIEKVPCMTVFTDQMLDIGGNPIGVGKPLVDEFNNLIIDSCWDNSGRVMLVDSYGTSLVDNALMPLYA
jgi:hypothetical protein